MAQKQFKDLNLNDKVPVEMPVAMILQAIAEYSNAEWSGPAVSHLMQFLQEAVLDPVFMRERLAEMQAARDQQEEVMKRIAPGLGFTGQFPFPEEPPE